MRIASEWPGLLGCWSCYNSSLLVIFKFGDDSSQVLRDSYSLHWWTKSVKTYFVFNFTNKIFTLFAARTKAEIKISISCAGLVGWCGLEAEEKITEGLALIISLFPRDMWDADPSWGSPALLTLLIAIPSRTSCAVCSRQESSLWKDRRWWPVLCQVWYRPWLWKWVMSGLMGQNCPRIQPVTHQRTRGELGNYLLFIFHSSDAGLAGMGHSAGANWPWLPGPCHKN